MSLFRRLLGDVESVDVRVDAAGTPRLREVPDFDWRTIPDVDREELLRFVGGTDAVERQFPLVLALQVHDELEARMMAPVKLDALQLAEIRGGLKALKRFCQIYKFRAVEENRKAPVVDYGEDE